MRSRKNLGPITTRENSGSRSFDPPRFFFVPVRYLPVITPAIHALVLTFLLPAYIVASNPDFVIMSPDISIISSIPSIFISKLKKTKLILDIRSTPVDTRGFRGSLRIFWFNISVSIAKRFFSGITIITPMMKKEISEKFSLNPRRIGVWSSGVSIELFDPKVWDRQGAELRTNMGLSGKFVVLYHGWFSDSRGINETIEAIRILSQSNSNIVFLLLGSGPSALELKSIVKKENIQTNVIVHDSVEYENVPKYIALCNVGIVPLPDTPYWRFQSPLKLLEYLAMGKVVILTDIPAHRSVIGEEKCGIYLSSTKPFEIAKAIEYARLNEKNLEKWGRIGREIVERNFDWKMVAMNLDEYLLSID
jgi:glycosyltransferase involved in cell wall biosynthesis